MDTGSTITSEAYLCAQFILEAFLATSGQLVGVTDIQVEKLLPTLQVLKNPEVIRVLLEEMADEDPDRTLI